MDSVLAGKIVDNSKYYSLYQIFSESYAAGTQNQKSLHEIDGNDYTYGELNEKINQFCHHFNNIGFQKGDRVGLFIANGLERIATILSLAKLGIVFIPFDPVLQHTKVQQILSQCSPKFVLIGSEHDYVTLWEKYDANVPILFMKDIKKPMLENSPSWPQVFQKDVFCILFTSGSTGTSKGVMLTHRNFINRLMWYWSEEPYQNDDVPLSKTNVLFLDCMFETFAPVLKCIPCVFMQHHHYQDFNSFVKYLHEYKITRLYLVPSLLKPLVMFTDGVWLRLRHVICSGEALPNDLASVFTEKFPSASLCNYYGTTEFPEVLTAKFSIERMSPDGNSIIGYPVDNTIVYIVNDDGSLVSTAGEQGELWVAGDNVSLGYLDADKTKAVYIKNPFTEHQQFATIYKTGDYVRLTTYGVEYLGRRDNFVKIRGHKVNLGDIEHAVKEILPASQVCVLSKFFDLTGQRLLYAFIAANDIFEEELNGLLVDRLPHFMLPRIVLLDQMPLMPTSGKIDRQVLLKNACKTSEANVTKIIATTDVEKIRYAASKILHIPIDKVEESKSFFQLGGDSITFFLLLGELKMLGIVLNMEKATNSLSLKDMVNNHDNVISNDTKLKVASFSELTGDEIIAVADMLCETFETGDALVYHLKNNFNFKPVLRGIVAKCKNYYPQYGAVVKLDEKMVAAVVNSPLDVTVNEKYPAPPEALEELFNHCTNDVIEELVSQNHNIMLNIIAFVDRNAPPEVGADALLLLSQTSTAIGNEYGHTVIVMMDTNAVTTMLDLDILRGKLAKTVYPSGFCYKGEYPFADLDSDFKITTVLEYLNKKVE